MLCGACAAVTAGRTNIAAQKPTASRTLVERTVCFSRILTVQLPFTEPEFLGIFAAYNSALWPVAVALWLATLGFSVELLRGRARPVALSALAVVHWAWSAVAYHAFFFTRINPAAWIFALLFVAQTFAFAWFGMARGRLKFDWGRTPRHMLAGLFLVYALLYPALVLLSGHVLPRAPAFAVPCPTTLFTAGLLFTGVPPVPRWLFVVPVVWSLIGGSAAVSLGMTPDLMLFVAGACLLVYGLAPRVFGASGLPSDALRDAR